MTRIRDEWYIKDEKKHHSNIPKIFTINVMEEEMKNQFLLEMSSDQETKVLRIVVNLPKIMCSREQLILLLFQHRLPFFYFNIFFFFHLKIFFSLLLFIQPQIFGLLFSLIISFIQSIQFYNDLVYLNFLSNFRFLFNTKYTLFICKIMYPLVWVNIWFFFLFFINKYY